MAIAAMGSIACNTSDLEETPLTPNTTHDVVLRASHGSLSRTELGESDGSTQAIRWSVGDQLLAWAESASTGFYAFEGATFTLGTYNATYESADFMATVGAMAEGTYTYHAVYPTPETRTGTTVSYTLPAVQRGTYDPALDVMTATTTGNALLPRSTTQTEIGWQEPELHFAHLFHLVRIRIPEGKNLLGQPIKRLDVIFPQEVVGTVSFDVKDPIGTATWSNLTNKITVELPDNGTVDAGSGYIWLHIKPGTLTGDLRFRAYGSAGVPSQEIAASIDKTFVAQRITPIALTIPQADETAYIEMSFTCPDTESYPNFLGEAATLMYVKAWPANLKPVAGTTDQIASTNGTFKVKFYALDTADYQYNNNLSGEQMQLAFASAHADVRAITYTTTLPTLSSAQPTYYALPYLFFEDFSGATTISSNDNNGNDTNGIHDTYPGVDLSGNNLPGWSGASFGIEGGVAARICGRWDNVLWVGYRRAGRMDSKALNIHSSTTVTTTFNYSAGRNKSNNMKPDAACGYTTTSGVINGVNNGSSTNKWAISGATKIDVSDTSGSYTVINKTMSYSLSGCTSSHRLSWEVSTTGSVANSNANTWMYIDNIKVSVGSSTKHTGLNYRSYFPNHTN